MSKDLSTEISGPVRRLLLQGGLVKPDAVNAGTFGCHDRAFEPWSGAGCVQIE